MALLARRYAAALFDVARAQGATAQVLDDLERLRALFGSAEGRALLGDPQTPRDAVRELVERELHAGAESTRNLALVLLQRRREGLLPELAPEFKAMVLREDGRVEATVEAARPLTDDEEAALRDQLARITGLQVDLSVEIVPDVIAGVRVRVGNTLYDGSLQGELEALHQHLLQAPVTRT